MLFILILIILAVTIYVGMKLPDLFEDDSDVAEIGLPAAWRLQRNADIPPVPLKAPVDLGEAAHHPGVLVAREQRRARLGMTPAGWRTSRQGPIAPVPLAPGAPTDSAPAAADDKAPAATPIPAPQPSPAAETPPAEGDETDAARLAVASEAPPAVATPAVATPAEPASAKTGSAKTGSANTETPGGDNLKMIRGIGPANEAKLKAIGVTTFAEIAAWGEKEQAEISERLAFAGRIEREKWVEQARVLAEGGATDFSRRVARGDVESSR